MCGRRSIWTGARHKKWDGLAVCDAFSSYSMTLPYGFVIVLAAGLAAGCAAFAWVLIGSAERAREAASRRAWLRAQCNDPIFRDHMRHFSDACARVGDDTLDETAAFDALRAGLVGLAAFCLFMFMGPLLVARRGRGGRARKEHAC